MAETVATAAHLVQDDEAALRAAPADGDQRDRHEDGRQGGQGYGQRSAVRRRASVSPRWMLIMHLRHRGSGPDGPDGGRGRPER
ncbi:MULTISPECIES: hypothetical protein [unclassified Streptomyces]|uniref:hypothetical protein n=1 Tax=unclassified Streptomyces TaxID=2593676 RepID=UPI0004BE0108|nr:MULTISPECIES: hypothetical protein [unclassified Streptomyces]